MNDETLIPTALFAAAPGILLVGCDAKVGWKSPLHHELGRRRPIARLAFEQWLDGQDETFGELVPAVMGSRKILQGSVVLSTMTGILTPRVLRSNGRADAPAVQLVDFGRGAWVAHCLVANRRGEAVPGALEACLQFVAAAAAHLTLVGNLVAVATDPLLGMANPAHLAAAAISAGRQIHLV